MFRHACSMLKMLRFTQEGRLHMGAVFHSQCKPCHITDRRILDFCNECYMKGSSFHYDGRKKCFKGSCLNSATGRNPVFISVYGFFLEGEMDFYVLFMTSKLFARQLHTITVICCLEKWRICLI